MTRGRHTPTKVTIRGIEYPSVSTAAKAIGVTRQAIHQGIIKGNVDIVGLKRDSQDGLGRRGTGQGAYPGG